MPQLGEIKKELQTSRTGKRRRRYHIWVKCPECGKEHWADYYHIKNGSPKRPGLCFPCSGYSQKGNGNPSWKGGRPTTSQGYIWVWLNPADFFYPMVRSGGYVLEHRLVMARHLGRCLQSWERVHHKGIRYSGIENKQDNLIDNLELTTNGAHSLAHSKGYKDGYQKGFTDGHNAKIKELETENEKLRRENNGYKS